MAQGQSCIVYTVLYLNRFPERAPIPRQKISTRGWGSAQPFSIKQSG
jgi:hypothetical protein